MPILRVTVLEIFFIQFSSLDSTEGCSRCGPGTYAQDSFPGTILRALSKLTLSIILCPGISMPYQSLWKPPHSFSILRKKPQTCPLPLINSQSGPCCMLVSGSLYSSICSGSVRVPKMLSSRTSTNIQILKN